MNTNTEQIALNNFTMSQVFDFNVKSTYLQTSVAKTGKTYDSSDITQYKKRFTISRDQKNR